MKYDQKQTTFYSTHITNTQLCNVAEITAGTGCSKHTHKASRKICVINSASISDSSVRDRTLEIEEIRNETKYKQKCIQHKNGSTSELANKMQIMHRQFFKMTGMIVL
jgi:ribonuclease HII